MFYYNQLLILKFDDVTSKSNTLNNNSIELFLNFFFLFEKNCWKPKITTNLKHQMFYLSLHFSRIHFYIKKYYNNLYIHYIWRGLLQNNGFYDKSIFIDNRDDDNNNAYTVYIIVIFKHHQYNISCI